MMMLDVLRKKHELIKAVAYARFSTDMQREESAEAQLRAIQQFADDNGIVIVDEYVDRAKSGTSADRVEFQRLLKDSSKRGFQLVLVHKLDRFARNKHDSITSKFHLKRSGVSVISVTQLYDSESPEGMLMETLLEGMAEYYSKNLSKEVMKGLLENAYKGLHTGGRPPLGYDLDRETKKLIVNEYEAELVKLIFKRFLEGFGYGEIIDELNLKGYKAKTGNGFTKNSLNSILKNEKYTGAYIFNRSASKDIDGKRNGAKHKDESEIVRVENAMPVIISKEDFQLVAEKLSKRKHAQKSSRAVETYLLRTKIVCGVCGGAYIGGRRKRSTKGGIWVFYDCNKRFRSRAANCNNKEISRTFIEGMVLEKLSDYVFNDKYIPKITQEYNGFLKNRNSTYQTQLHAYQTRLKELEQGIDVLVGLLMKTQSQALLDRLHEHERDKILVEANIDKLKRDNKQLGITESQIKEVFAKIREMLKSGNLRTIKQIIDTYVSKVVVYPENVIIHFNFFPSITLELDHLEDNEKDCPLTDYADSRGQSNSFIQNDLGNRPVGGGGEGGTRTLAPVTRPTPLAGAPRHQLEYFSIYTTLK